MKDYLFKGGRSLFFLCWMAYAVSYIGRLDFSSCMSSMVADGIFSTEQGGAIGTAFLACYGTGQLVNGFVGDRITPKSMIFIGLVGSGAMNILMAFAAGAAAGMVIWGFNGFFCSMLWAPVVRCMSEYMNDAARAKYSIHISSTIPTGTVVAYLLSSLLLSLASWRSAFIVSGVIVAAAGFIWLFGTGTLKNYLSEIRAANLSVRRHAQSDKKRVAFFPMLAMYGVVLTSVAILFNGVLKDGITLWIPTFLTTSFGISASFAAAISVVLPLINLFGAFAANYINRKLIRNEMATGAVMFGVSVVTILCLYFFGDVSVVLSALLLAITTSSMLGANTMYLTFIPLSFGRLGRSSSVTGFLDACSYLASAVSSVLIGITAVRLGWSFTVLMWAAVALAGGIISLSGAGKWAQSKRRLEGADTAQSVKTQ